MAGPAATGPAIGRPAYGTPSAADLAGTGGK